MRRVAVSRLIVDGQTLRNQVIEMQDGRLLRYYPLTEELAFTEWRRETIHVSPNGTIETTKI